MGQPHKDLIRFPALREEPGSLTPIERSVLGHFILLVRPRLIVELGVFKAVTTQFICDFLVQNGIEGTVVGFDLPEIIAGLRNSNEGVQHHESTSRLRLIPGKMPGSLASWLSVLGEEVDLALVDATHNYRSVMGELSLLWPRLSAQGYILCHDYSGKYEGVRYAVDRFAAKKRAMALPLASSDLAREAGHASVLVAICRRPYRPTLSHLLHHVWLSAKVDLLDHPVVNKTWTRWIKPFVRRGNE